MEVGFGPLALKPDEFWELTPVELHLMAEGWKWRHDNTRQLMAWAMSNLIQPHTKRRLSPKMFLGDNRQTPLPTSRAEFNAMMARAKRLEE